MLSLSYVGLDSLAFRAYRGGMAPDADIKAQEDPAEHNPLVLKLDLIARLTEEDKRALREICSDKHQFPANRDIISEGDSPDHIHLMLEGWAARYKVVRDGGRQITAYLIPGDFCDLHVTVLRAMDHGITALTPVTVAFIPPKVIEELPIQRPELARALLWATLVDEAVLRNWIVNLGRRDARERVSHLMCEMHLRMHNIGLADDGSFSMPLTQEEIADTMGLSPVHTNRVLQQLRRDGLITFKGRTLTIPDVHALRSVAGFDPSYLHLKQR
jgi:CRP-like cAMP-binding protein